MTTTTVSHTAALARFGGALADETRAQILLELRGGPGYPSDLAESLGVSRQVMSNHLACLRGCGLVEGVRDGRRTRYRLSTGQLESALGGLLGLVLQIDPQCCTPEGCSCQ